MPRLPRVVLVLALVSSGLALVSAGALAQEGTSKKGNAKGQKVDPAGGTAQAAPNLFTLSSTDLRVSYVTRSVDGKPRLSWEDVKKGVKATFAGDQIRLLDTEVGRL